MFKETNKTINKLNQQIDIGLGRKQITLTKSNNEEILEDETPILPKRISNSTDGRQQIPEINQSFTSESSPCFNKRKSSVQQEKQLPAISPDKKESSKTPSLPKPKMGKPPISKPEKQLDTFNYKYIKILIKSQSKDEGGSDERTVMLRRSWIEKQNVIPHFANVIKTVGPNEGVEITMNCNSEAFDWIIDLAKIKSNFSEEPNFEPLTEKEIKSEMNQKFSLLDDENCLNKLVTSHFL